MFAIRALTWCYCSGLRSDDVHPQVHSSGKTTVYIKVAPILNTRPEQGQALPRKVNELDCQCSFRDQLDSYPLLVSVIVLQC